MNTTPRLTFRSEGLVELLIRRVPDVKGYRFSAANTLNQAFASPTVMFTTHAGSLFKSPSVIRRGNRSESHEQRVNTTVQYNPEDFWTASSNLPHDAHFSYVRVEEENNLGVYRPAGPILIVPNPGFFSNTRPSLIVAGTAPNVAATSIGIPPDGSLQFVLPKFADAASITNNGGASLFISFNRGMPEFEVLTGGTTFLPDGAMSEVFIRGSGATVAFSIFFAIVNAEMA